MHFRFTRSATKKLLVNLRLAKPLPNLNLNVFWGYYQTGQVDRWTFLVRLGRAQTLVLLPGFLSQLEELKHEAD